MNTTETNPTSTSPTSISPTTEPRTPLEGLRTEQARQAAQREAEAPRYAAKLHHLDTDAQTIADHHRRLHAGQEETPKVKALVHKATSRQTLREYVPEYSKVYGLPTSKNTYRLFVIRRRHLEDITRPTAAVLKLTPHDAKGIRATQANALRTLVQQIDDALYLGAGNLSTEELDRTY